MLYCMRNYRLHTVGMLCVVILGICVQPVQAGLVADQVIGEVDHAEESTGLWEPLSQEGAVDVGYLVRTAFGAATDLLGTDGSLLLLDEITQLAIHEFEYTPDQEIRIARFSILEGVVTADAAHFDYATNIFEIETPTVTASFKFSKAQFKVDKQGNTNVTLFNGKFDLQQRPGVTARTRARHTSEDGVETEFSFSQETEVNIETTPEGLKTENTGSSPVEMSVGGQPVELSPGASVEMSTGEGQPVIQNTSPSEEAEVKVGGVLVGSEGTLTLTQTDTQSDAQSAPDSQPESTADVQLTDEVPAATTEAPVTTPDIFHNINQGSTSSSVPATAGGGASEGPVPGERPSERQIIRIPVEVTSE